MRARQSLIRLTAGSLSSVSCTAHARRTAHLMPAATSSSSGAFPDEIAAIFTGTSGTYWENLLEDFTRNPADIQDEGVRRILQAMLDSATIPAPSSPTTTAAVSVSAGTQSDRESSATDAELHLSVPADIPEVSPAPAVLTQDLLGLLESEGHVSHLGPAINPLSGNAPPEVQTNVAEFTRVLEKFAFNPRAGGCFTPETTPEERVAAATAFAQLGRTPYHCEYADVQDTVSVAWLRDRLLTPQRIANNPMAPGTLSDDVLGRLLCRTADAVEFENILKTKFGSTKRFGSDGAESFVVGLQSLIDRAVGRGKATSVVLAMAHRGRLSTLHNIAGKPLAAIITEFSGRIPRVVEGFQGDVKYHTGMHHWRTLWTGELYEIELVANPSHLESANAIALGYCYARQRESGSCESTIPIVLHGDASFSGQYTVFESIAMEHLPGYETGGVVHVVVDNQIGFTSLAENLFTSPHCASLANTFNMPVLHVNGDDVESVHRVFELAADYRQSLGRSIMVHIVAYRRYGHNEGDDPFFTQPVMYQSIRKLPDVCTIFARQHGLDEMPARNTARNRYRDLFRAATHFGYDRFLEKQIAAQHPSADREDFPTSVDADILAPVIEALATVPKDFTLPKDVTETLASRNAVLKHESGIDWATAEALAFGTLLGEGFDVRVSGEDAQRGAAARRHAVLRDISMKEYIPLQHIPHATGRFEVQPNVLCENGLLDFEFGFGLGQGRALAMWEAQYGSFINEAQQAFDQYVSSSFAKWGLPANVIISLSHGYDGRGPEHSTGRIERILQASLEHDETPEMSEEERHRLVNLEVAIPSTPKQYFHVLRRHMHREIIRPLVLFIGKGPFALNSTSTLVELSNDRFEPVIDDPRAVKSEMARADVKRVVLCSGQVYFRLLAARNELNPVARDAIALLRIEELSPLPLKELREVLSSYPVDASVVWCQEEPRNMGTFRFLQPHLDRIQVVRGSTPICYAGRPGSASPATGFFELHEQQNKVLVAQALTIE